MKEIELRVGECVRCIDGIHLGTGSGLEQGNTYTVEKASRGCIKVMGNERWWSAERFIPSSSPQSPSLEDGK